MRLEKKTVAFFTLIGMLFVGVVGCGGSEENVKSTETQSEMPMETESLTEMETEEVLDTETLHNEFFRDSGLNTFELSSEDLHEGVWDTVITNTSNGSNVSPQLTWEAVEDAACYVIYMVDSSAGDWLHWKTNNVTETSLPQGWASASEYVGPYPPPGATHDYEVYVIAIKQPVERAKGALKTSNPGLKDHIWALDTEAGVSGNILAYGHIVGTYTAGK